MGKTKKGQAPGESKFDGFGVDFKCKLIGSCDVNAARGDDVCQGAVDKLKQHALKMNKEKKEHKQRITVNITLKGIRLLDEQTERIEHGHPIQRISFISHDKTDKRTFGYIVCTKEGYKLFAIRTPKEAELITKTLKELFQEVFDRHQDAKSRASEQEKENVQPAEEITEQHQEQQSTELQVDDGLLNWDTLNEQIQVMQNDGLPRVNSVDMLSDLSSPAPVTPNPFGDSFNTTTANTTTSPSVDLFATADVFSPPPTQQPKGPSASEELFNLTAPPPTPQKTEGDCTDAPLLISDPFADLKKNIDQLHKQNQQFNYPPQQGAFPGQQQGGFPGQQAGFAPQQGGFPQQQQGGFPQQQQGGFPAQPTPRVSNCPPMVANNPFGAGPMYTPRPATNNPFFQAAPVVPSPVIPQETGWTVNQPKAAPRPDVKKTPAANSSAAGDPFAFLNNQTGGTKGFHTTNTTPMASQPNNNVPIKPLAQNDLFDLLG